MPIYFFLVLIIFLSFLQTPVSAQTPTIGLYDIFQTQLTNTNSYTNPFDFNEIELNATFTAPSGKQTNFFGFYDGDGNGGQSGNVWKLRFMPDEVGTWSYTYSWTGTSPNKPAGTFGPFTFTVVDTGLPGPLKVASDNSWYFEDSRGKPFHWRPYGLHVTALYAPTHSYLSDIGWVKNLVQTRIIDKGYNFTMLDPNLGDRVGAEGQYSWNESWWLNTTDTKRFNLPVWNAWEEELQLTKNNQVYVISFADMVWQGSRYNFTDFKVFLRYWTARFAPYYNYFGWSPTWEWTDIYAASDVNQIMGYLYSIDPWKRMLSVHDCSSDSFVGWLKFSMRQAHTNNALSGNNRLAGQSQGSCGETGGIGDNFRNSPIIGSEDLWESTFSSMPRNATEVRRGAWGIQMGGMMPLYSEWTPDPPPTGGNGQGEPEVRRMFDFFYTKTRYRQYQQLNNLVSSGARQIASGIPGEEYLVYDEDGGSITINLSGVSSSKSLSVLWFDPKNGNQQTASDVLGGASRTLTSPFTGDSVLLLGGVPVDTTPPSTVTLSASANGQYVNLSWTASSDLESGISGYRIYRKEGASGTYSLLTSTSNVTSYTDAATKPATIYFYQIAAVNGALLEGTKSNEVNQTTLDTPPTAPAGLTARPSDSQVTLFWSANSEGDLAGYNLYRSTTSGGPYTRVNTTLITSTSFTDTTLTNNTTYYYVIRAQDTAGQESPNSTEAAATPSELLIVTLENYQGGNAPPTVEDAGTAKAFKVGSPVVNDRADTWTQVPPELTDQTRLLTARNDRMQPPIDSKYIVSVTQPVTVYVTLDPRYTTNNNFPSWISSQGWTRTTLNAVSSASSSNWTIHKKDYPVGSITLGVDTQGYDGVTYIFVKQPVSPTPKPGDTNNDGSVNILDLSILLTNFGLTVTPNTNGDVDGNGVVDLSDLAILLTNFGM